MFNLCSPLKLILIISISAWLTACGGGGSDGDGGDDGGILLVECPSSSSTPTDICGTVVAGKALVLPVEGAVFTIPADALPPGTAIRLTVVDPATLDTPPNGAGEALITPVYSIEFSTTELVIDYLSFVLDIPSPVNARWDAHIKTEGGLATEGLSDVDWRMTFGDYDELQSSLLIELGATAGRYLIAGVSGAAVTPSVAAGSVNEKTNIPEPTTVGQKTAAFGGPEWNALGWVIFCVPADFTKFNNTKCSPSSPQFFDMMTDLGAKLYASDQVLSTLGFPVGKMNFINENGIARSKGESLIYDPDNRSATTSSIGGFPPHYFVAFVSPNTTDGAVGLYFPSREEIVVDIGGPDTTVIHELMHAVQYERIPKAFGRNWIIEGLASAVSVFAPSSSVATGEDYRWKGQQRNWIYPLNSEQRTDEYEAAEYWLSWDGSLVSLPDLYDRISHNRINESNEYDFINEMQVEVGTASMRDAYLALIQSRNDDAEYPHCVTGFFPCTGSSCTVQISDFFPMSADCTDFSVDFTDACVGEPTEMSVALEPSEANPNMKLMVDGVIYDPDTEVPFEGDARIWAINTDYAPGFTASSAAIVFRNVSPTCGKLIQLERQKIFAGANADATSNGGNTLSPTKDVSADTYTSYEDLFLDSFITSFEWLRKPDQEIKTVVAPLGLNAWSASPSVTAAHRCDDVMFPGCDTTVSTATASATVTTDTDNDATSMTTIGSHALSATIGNKARLAIATGTNEYTYIVAGESVELTLTWGCDMSHVLINLVNPDTRSSEQFYNVRNDIDQNNNNWECGRKVWLLPTDKLVYIRLNSQFDEYFSDAGSPETWKNNGGAFEIKLKAILP